MHRARAVTSARGYEIVPSTPLGWLRHRSGARTVMLRALAMAAAVAAAVTALAPISSAAPSRRGGPLTLEIWPGGGPQRTRLAHTLKAQVTRDNGGGANGVVVDFEVTEGPGDDDIGTPGATPETPDLSCVTAGGSAHRPATCTVSYVEQDNVGGSDAVLAWIDADDLDATVEADLGEGENQHAPGPGGCAVGSKGPGSGDEPDATDCVDKRWMARVPAAVDLSPESGWADVGATAALDALVFDQFGDPVAGSTVGVEILGGSAHDPGDGTDFGSPDVGTCSTGETGGCSVPFVSSRAGADLFCAYVAGDEAACLESPDAPERHNGADVVRRSWGVFDPPSSPDQSAEEAPAEGDEQGRAIPGAGRREEEPPERRRPDDAREWGGAERSPESAGAPSEPTRAPGAATPTQPKTRSQKRERRSSSDAPPDAGRHARPPRHRSSRHRLLPDAGRSAAPMAGGENERLTPRTRAAVDDRLARLSRVAAKTAERYSFPLALMLLILGFIAVQGRIDHRDPKLRLAPVDSKHDLLPFT